MTPRGTLLAYCEGRAGGGDWTPQDILMRRSTDGGRTWSAARVISAIPADARPNPVAAKQRRGPVGKLTAHNAVAIADAAPGVVHFLYHVEYERVFYTRSADDGATWSAPREITDVLKGFRDRYDWKVAGNGCGHGIQLARGAHPGRLVVAVWLSLGTQGNGHRPSDLATIYSDDHGEHWKCGEFIARSGDAAASRDLIENPNETALAELPDGRVLANIRSESKPNRRLLAVSADGAAGWTKPAFHDQLAEPICMGSMAELKDGGILFANPDNLLVKGKLGNPGQGRERRNLTVKETRDGGKTWKAVKVVAPGWSGYSDLAVGADGIVYCFYERGAEPAKAFRPAALVLMRFKVE
jgi:sialidase-1